MFSIENQVEIFGGEQVTGRAEHSVRMTIAEKGGRAIMRVLAKDAKVISASAVPLGGEVEASGRVVVSAICEIAGGEILPLEYLGVFSFTHKAGKNGTATGDVSAMVSAVRVLRVSGCEVVCEVDFAITENFSVTATEKAVVSAVDCYSECGEVRGVSAVLKVHDFTAVAEFEVAKSVSSVLCYQFFAESLGVLARAGSVVCSGNIHGWVCYSDTSGEIHREARSFPFREEFSCEACEEFACFARAGECGVVCAVNEVRDVTQISCDVQVEISLWGYKSQMFQCGDNFFSDKLEITAEKAEFTSSALVGSVQACEKFSGIVDLPFDTPQKVEIASARIAVCNFNPQTAVASGEVVCCVCGDRKFHESTLPFQIAFPLRGGDSGSCDVVVSEIGARLVAGKVEVFGKVCGNVAVYRCLRENIVTSLFAGAKKADLTCGFVLYRGEAGETLLEICAAVGVMPNVLKAQNPNVVFPLEQERKLVVWR